MQTEDAQMAVIGLTARVDAADLLEKRVQSRFSRRQMRPPLLNAIAVGDEHQASDCARLIDSALALPAAEERPGRHAYTVLQVGRRYAAEAIDAYARAWAAAVKSLCAGLSGSSVLRRRLLQGLSAGELLTAVRLLLVDLSEAKPLPSIEALDTALHQMGIPPSEWALAELSVVELLLLLCLKKLADREEPTPHTLKMVLREYAEFVSSDNAQYDYPKPLLTKAFEHLVDFGLVRSTWRTRTSLAPTDASCASECGQVRIETHVGARRASVPPGKQPLLMLIDSTTLHEWVKSGKVPTQVQRFGTSWLA